jgi:hypothetical protein
VGEGTRGERNGKEGGIKKVGVSSPGWVVEWGTSGGVQATATHPTTTRPPGGCLLPLFRLESLRSAGTTTALGGRLGQMCCTGPVPDGPTKMMFDVSWRVWTLESTAVGRTGPVQPTVRWHFRGICKEKKRICALIKLLTPIVFN